MNTLLLLFDLNYCVYNFLFYLMYINQNVVYQFANYIPQSWSLKNEVEQGGILTTLSFFIFRINLLNTAPNCKKRCKLSTMYSDIIPNADDLVILSQFVSEPHLLINKIYNDAKELNVKFNLNKSSIIVSRQFSTKK